MTKNTTALHISMRIRIHSPDLTNELELKLISINKQIP